MHICDIYPPEITDGGSFTLVWAGMTRSRVLVPFCFRALRPPLPLGWELRRETKLPFLLHLHRVAVLSDGIHLRLCDNTSSAKYACALRYPCATGQLHSWPPSRASSSSTDTHSCLAFLSGAQGGRGLVFALQESPGRYLCTRFSRKHFQQASDDLLLRQTQMIIVTVGFLHWILGCSRVQDL